MNGLSPNKSRFDRIIGTTDNIRKLAVNLFLIAAFLIVMISLFIHYNKKQLLIYPFEIPASLKTPGYTGQIVTSMVIDHIHQIKAIGSSYYSSQNIEMPSWDNGVDEFKDAINNEGFTQINGFIRFLFNKKIQTGTGEIINPRRGLLKINFRIGDDLMTVTRDSAHFNALIDTTAEFALEKLDPYELAGYYLLTKQRAKSLRICQQLLNSIDKKKDKDNYALALMLRGSAYLDLQPSPNNLVAEKILNESLTYIKKRNPWLIYNNLAVAYYYQGNFKQAAKMYRLSLDSDSAESGNNMNYGNLLRTKYENGHYKYSQQIDSAISFYRKAIDHDKKSKNAYLMLIVAFYDKADIGDAQEYYTKLKEMDPVNYQTYFTIGFKQEMMHRNIEAVASYSMAEVLCSDPKMKADLAKEVDSLKGAKEPAIKKTK